MKVLNYATKSLKKPKWKRTPEGWLRCKARVLAERVLPYSRSELADWLPPDISGDPINMLVTKQAMSEPAALSSLEGIPIVAGEHVWLDEGSNVQQFAVGSVSGTPKIEGQYLICDLLVTNPEAIRAIEAEELPEVSAAYTAETIFDQGEFENSHYHCQQQLLRFNHIAIIPAGSGRAGADVRIFNTKGEMKMSSYENGRKKAMAELEDRINTLYEDDGAVASFTNSRVRKGLKDSYQAGQEALHQIVNQRRSY